MPDSSRRASVLSEVNERSAQWREKLDALRQTDVAAAIPVEQVLQFAGHALSIREVVGATWQTQCAARLASGESPQTLPRSGFATLAATRPILDPQRRESLHCGHAGSLHSKLAATSGRLDDGCLTWVFTVLSRLYPGGQGDRRAFHYVVYAASGGILYVVRDVVFLTPALSSYLIFSMLLFVTLFLFGYLTQAVPGVSFAMRIRCSQQRARWH